MKLLIEKAADDKIRAYTALCPSEISGLGKIRRDGDDFIVTDVAIFEQSVSGVHSTIPTIALAKFQEDMVKKGESMKDWVLWWHSHADMSVFFSTTDTDTIAGSTEFPYLVSLVVNKARENKARIDVFSPVHMYAELDVEIISEENEEIKQLCQAEIDAKVKRAVNIGFSTKRSPTVRSPYQSRYDEELEMWVDREMGMPPQTAGARDLWGEGLTDLREEYHSHKRYLMKALNKARRKSRHQDAQRIQRELSEHIVFGRSCGYEITKEIE